VDTIVCSGTTITTGISFTKISSAATPVDDGLGLLERMLDAFGALVSSCSLQQHYYSLIIFSYSYWAGRFYRKQFSCSFLVD
jgi:hypothetical protein